MCKSTLGFQIALAFLLAFAIVSQAQYSGGSGTPDDPCQIWTDDDWKTLMNTPADWSKHFILMADLDLKDVTLSPVGSYSRHFTGVFDGNGHVIRNAVIKQPNSDYVGLFGYLDQGGQIRDVGVVDANITGSYYVGGLLGKNAAGGIIDCYTDGKAAGLISGRWYVGGLVGDNSTGDVNNCHAACQVEATGSYVGGLVGRNDEGILTSCSASGAFKTNGDNAGALVGDNSGGSIIACSAAGSVSGSYYVGGLVGKNSAGHINDCSAAVSVSGRWYVGGLVGETLNARLLACSATGPVEATGSFAGGLVGYDDRGTLIACSALGNVKAEGDNIGGLVGYTSAGSLRICSAAGSVTGSYYVGGLAGKIPQGQIDNCFAAGRVSGRWYVGGLAGDASNGNPFACYSVGYVTGTGSYIGGLAGHDSGSIESKTCFWDIETSGQTTSALGTGKTTAEMKRRSTFTAAGWDFLDESQNGIAETWTIRDVNYPELCWQVYYRIAYAPNPPDGAGDVDPNVNLSWIPSITAARHDVYLDDTLVGSPAEPNFTLVGLAPGTTYYWRIDEVNDADPNSPWKGHIWSFTVPLRKAHNPVPADDANEVDPNVVLAWTPGYGALSHTVYFGEDFNNVNNATGGAAQEPNTYVPGTLDSRKTYYWRVDEFDGSRTHRGDVWSFTVRQWLIYEGIQVSASKDDGYAIRDGLQQLEFDFLRVGSSPSSDPPYYMSGMVFRGVNLPQGVRIVSARLKIRSHNDRLTAEVYGTIQAEDTDNAESLDKLPQIAERPTTDASVDWDHIEPWSPDTWYESPDIAAVIQEVISRNGWSAGNSLALFYGTRQRKGGFRQFSSYDRGADVAPVLEITYEP